MYIAEDPLTDIMVAPERITAANRLMVRRQALEYLERASQSRTPLTIDLRSTVDIDASGLGILVLLQKRAREYGLIMRLIAPQPAIREALRAARLDYLFEILD